MSDEDKDYTCDDLRAALESMDVVWERSTVDITERHLDGRPKIIRAAYVGSEREEDVFAKLNKIKRPRGCTLYVYEKH